MTTSVALACAYFDAWRCRSCSLLDVAYDLQLADQQAGVEAALPPMAWDAPHASAVGGFRNKAKMAVAGSVDAPTLGILAADGSGIDLRACPLHEQPIVDAMPTLEALVGAARLTPYDVPGRRGELKHLILTSSPDGELALRLVLRSSESLPRIRKHLAVLDGLPLTSVSANLQPEHKAVLEGDEEVLGRASEAVEPPHGDQIELAGAGVGHHPVEGGTAVLRARHPVIHVLGGLPAPLLRHHLQLVKLEPDVLAVADGRDSGVEGGADGSVGHGELQRWVGTATAFRRSAAASSGRGWTPASRSSPRCARATAAPTASASCGGTALPTWT